jgi:transposase
VPENITLVPLPPKCPELNPVENNWISNRIFKSYEAIVDSYCSAWNKLIDMPWKITSISILDWAHRF